MKVDVFSITGKASGKVDLPDVFDEVVRADLIQRAVLSEQSKRFQPKGVFKEAGLQTSADYKGRKEDYRSIKNHGISRLPREKLPKGKFGKVRIVPFSVGGRRAHPPNPNKILFESINKKEHEKAIRSAIAATGHFKFITARGHAVDGLKFPLVVESSIEEVSKTKNVLAAFNTLGLSQDIEKSRARKARSGARKNRRGGSQARRSVLLVIGQDKGVSRGARNIPGVEVVLAEKLSAEVLAPGGQAGRLTVYSQSALDKLGAKV